MEEYLYLHISKDFRLRFLVIRIKLNLTLLPKDVLNCKCRRRGRVVSSPPATEQIGVYGSRDRIPSGYKVVVL
jgi:hypothetical protein